jgi:hypothetical protein
MEIYQRPQGMCFRHDNPVNDGRFSPSLYYYESVVELPASYYEATPEIYQRPWHDHRTMNVVGCECQYCTYEPADQDGFTSPQSWDDGYSHFPEG